MIEQGQARSKFDAVQQLQTGIELTTGDRRKTHGDFYENHQTIAALWSAVLKIKITAWQVAACMNLVKVARLFNGATNPDDGVDGAVYITRAVECKARDEAGQFKVDGDWVRPPGYDPTPGGLNIAKDYQACAICGGLLGAHKKGCKSWVQYAQNAEVIAAGFPPPGREANTCLICHNPSDMKEGFACRKCGGYPVK